MSTRLLVNQLWQFGTLKNNVASTMYEMEVSSEFVLGRPYSNI